MKEHLVRRARAPIPLSSAWDDPAWSCAPPLEISEFRPEGGDHRPRTRARLLHAEQGLHGIFRVEDRYVVCRHTGFQEQVCEDSCVEIFLQPKPNDGYFNFEMNCGGTLHATHVTDHRREGGALGAASPLTAEQGRQVAIRTTLPPVVVPEITTALDWELSFFVPSSLLEAYVGPLGALAGQEWRANLYKCADRASHPHWGAWSAVDALNFHLPHCFGRLRFAP